MPLLIQHEKARSAYHGLDTILEFINNDGDLSRTNCGLAAAATFLTHFHLAGVKGTADLMALLEKRFPPDILGGMFGTSRHRVRRILRYFGCRIQEIVGETAFRHCLKKERPVIVMLEMPQGKLFNRFDVPGGHWMVAYGFDDDNVYLTNWGPMTWADFRTGWNGVVPALIGMRRRGLISPLAAVP